MKKSLKLMLVLMLCLACGMLVGCGSDSDDDDPYVGLDYDSLVTLPDYDSYTVDAIEVDVTDSEVEEEIETRLESAGTTEDVTEGTVDEGDEVTISFDGTLADGTSVDGMSSDSYSLTLGSGSMIDGFEEGLYGATIGEEVTLDLTFPEDYSANEDLSGKDVTFKVTVLSKQVSVAATLDEDFVKENSSSGSTTVEEYKAEVKKELEEEAYEDEENSRKTEIFNQICDEATVESVPDELIQYESELMRTTYENYAESYSMEWEDVLSSLDMTQEEFDEQLQTYAEEMAQTKMIAYALAEKEGVSYTTDEVVEYLLSLAGVDSEETFETNYGTAPAEYAKSYNGYGMKTSMMLDDSLNQIYDRIA